MELPDWLLDIGKVIGGGVSTVGGWKAFRWFFRNGSVAENKLLLEESRKLRSELRHDIESLRVDTAHLKEAHETCLEQHRECERKCDALELRLRELEGAA